MKPGRFFFREVLMSLSMKDFNELLCACMTSDAERRDTTRTLVSVHVCVTRRSATAGTLPTVEAKMVDIAQEGLGLLCDVAMTAGEEVIVELPPVDGNAPLRVGAVVRHCHHIAHLQQ